jgi:Leucine-rich repeat (LRR) protein
MPEVIFKLKNLTHLYIEDNLIEEIPEAINQLSKLKYLEIGFNGIKKLPENLDGLSNLKTIIISSHPIVETSQFSDEVKMKIKQLLPNCEIIE